MKPNNTIIKISRTSLENLVGAIDKLEITIKDRKEYFLFSCVHQALREELYWEDNAGKGLIKVYARTLEAGVKSIDMIKFNMIDYDKYEMTHAIRDVLKWELNNSMKYINNK